MGRPVVAVIGETGTMSWSMWKDVRAVRLAWSYVEKVVEAGGAPVVLPPVPDLVEDVLASVDALLLPGGADIHPRRYGAAVELQVMPFEEDRDETDFRAVDVAFRRGIPVLGLCRGLQVISIARGGTLHQHLPEHAPTVLGTYDPHRMEIKPGSRLGAALGRSTTLSCHHHQGIDRLGDGLVPTAWAEDGVVEAVEAQGAAFVVGVQSHPEVDTGTGQLFRAFVEAAS